MATPVVSAVTFDKASYTPGSLITATVLYSDPNVSSNSYVLTGNVTDTSGQVGTLSATFTVGSPNSASAAVSGGEPGQVWTKVSDDGKSRAVFTATA
jgi:hypothetical protein